MTVALTLLVGQLFPVPGVNFGTVDVNPFFVLSGLPIGGLLFEKHEPLARFHRRRLAWIVQAHLALLSMMRRPPPAGALGLTA